MTDSTDCSMDITLGYEAINKTIKSFTEKPTIKSALVNVDKQ